MENKTFDQMTGPELVMAHNQMVRALAELGNTRYKATQRFADRESGLRRCQVLASSLRAAEASERATGEAAEAYHRVAISARLRDQGELGASTAIQAEEGAGQQSDSPTSEEDDMAARRKAKAAKATKTRQARRAANGAGPTLRQLTEEFNSLVPKAERKGLTWPKHHTSMFESRATAEKQLKRLRKELG